MRANLALPPPTVVLPLPSLEMMTLKVALAQRFRHVRRVVLAQALRPLAAVVAVVRRLAPRLRARLSVVRVARGRARAPDRPARVAVRGAA